MVKNTIHRLLFAFLLISGIPAFAQDLKLEERKLIEDYLKAQQAGTAMRMDSLGPYFKRRLLQVLELPGSFTYPFDSLSVYITRAASPDKRLRSFSWDENTGKSNHLIAAVLQFTDEKGKLHTNLLSTSDALYYEWHQLKVKGVTHYLSFGYGSYGSRNHFKRVNAFRISEQGLLWVTGLFNWSAEFGDALFIMAPRKKKIYLEYDDQKNELVFRHFIQKDFDNIKFKKGKKIHLTLQDGFFQVK